MTPEEREFLLSLKSDPRWEGVLKSLSIRCPKFRPGDNEKEFLYESVRFYENERILAILNLRGDLP